MGKLSALTVRSAKAGRHADGDGLYLLVKPTGARSWLLRVQVDGMRRDVGLGSVDTSARRPDDDPTNDVPILQRRVLSLVEAREKAAVLRRLAKSGRNPIAERDKDRRTSRTFKEAAEAYEILSDSERRAIFDRYGQIERLILLTPCLDLPAIKAKAGIILWLMEMESADGLPAMRHIKAYIDRTG